MDKFYSLPELPYSYDALAPVMSAEQLMLHHDKHHKAYVDKANELLEKLDQAKEGDSELDFGVIAKKLSFNVGGHILHSLFWENLQSPSDNNRAEGDLEKAINENFGSVEKLQKQFFEVATTVEGSGWTALFYCKKTGRLLIGQIQNHNLNIYPDYKALLVLDMWEHAFYIDYKNDKKKFAENFWLSVNWEVVRDRYIEAIK
ncbi:MAG: superoxide dismutase [Patescibacteria group bacterium]